jgi:hypothetical protein
MAERNTDLYEIIQYLDIHIINDRTVVTVTLIPKN